MRARSFASSMVAVMLLGSATAGAGGFGGMQFNALSFDRASPEQGLPPWPYSSADVYVGGFLIPQPAWRPFGDFGLVAADDIDAITFGGAGCVPCPPGDGFLQQVFFSVDRNAQGAPGIGDAIQFEVNVDGAAGDIFVQTNNDALKGQVALACNGGFRFGVGCILGLTNDNGAPYSNTDAWSGGGPVGVLDLMPVLFSVDPVTAGNIGVSGADIFLDDPLGPDLEIAIPFAGLGLVAADNIDALDASMADVRAPAPGDWIYFSLAAGSPTLIAIGASPGDILVKVLGNAGPPQIWSPAAAHGLLFWDDLDALDIWDPGFPQLTEDGGFLEDHAGHRCSWPVPIDAPRADRHDEGVVEHTSSIPSPANCTVDACMVACPGGDALFQVIVRDIANNRIFGSTVELDFSECAEFVPCPTGNAYTLDWDRRSIRTATDPLGVASFPLRGGGSCGPSTVEVRADGVLIATRSLSSPDLDASLMVDGVDRLLLSAIEGGAGPQGDFDCSGLVSGAFDPQDPPPPPPLLDAPPPARPSAELSVRVSSNPVRAGVRATIQLAVRASGPVVAELIDLSGRRIERLPLIAASTGASSHDWRVPQGLAAGVYSLRVRSGTAEASTRVIVVSH